MSIGSNIRALTKTHREAWEDGEKKFKTFHKRARRASEITQPREHRKVAKRRFYLLD